MWSNIKTVVKENVSSENLPTFRWSVIMMMQLCTINKQISINKPSNKLKLFKKNFRQKYLTCNDLFLEKKRIEKENGHNTGRWILLSDGVIDSSIVQNFFHLSQNAYHETEDKPSWDVIKRMGSCLYLSYNWSWQVASAAPGDNIC